MSIPSRERFLVAAALVITAAAGFISTACAATQQPAAVATLVPTASVPTRSPAAAPPNTSSPAAQIESGDDAAVKPIAAVPDAEPAEDDLSAILRVFSSSSLQKTVSPSASDSNPNRELAGIRAVQVPLSQAPLLAIESEIDWRPPPYPVPLSLHPDDHYWLQRPLPSDSRSYDLEWYPYGNRPMRSQSFPYRVHHGLDFPNSRGTPIFAASSGTVIWAGPMANPVSGVNYYGNTVVIEHDWLWKGQTVYTLYAHTLELFVEVGQRVDQGQLIAGVGSSGEVSGPHLHLEVRIGANNYHSTRNPNLWLAPYEGWGTLAGRFVDDKGRLIHGALVTVRPIKLEAQRSTIIRRQRTYSETGPNSDEIWRENFVVADLPAGQYMLVLEVSGTQFSRDVIIYPGQTNFVVVQTDFPFVPTPIPTPSPSPTATLTVTQTIENQGTPSPVDN